MTRRISSSLASDSGGIDACAQENGRNRAVLLLEQGDEEVLERRLRVVLAQCKLIRSIQRLLHALGHALDVHVTLRTLNSNRRSRPSPLAQPEGQREK
jgi:hypothetical protein